MFNLTEFGSAVRKARIDAKVTMQQMATDLGVSAAFLSALEVGRKKVSAEWVAAIEKYFKTKKVKVPDLRPLADVANRSVPLDGVSPQQAMLLAGFARTSLTKQQMEMFKKLLSEAEGGR
jgi:transcriptional regulator with XRE-family HTH domain